MKQSRNVKWRSRLNRKSVSLLASTTALLLSSSCFANYACRGTVGYLGVDADGGVTIALTNSTPIHKICSVGTQGTYGISVASCKIAYAAFLSARLAGKNMVVYYNDNGLTCASLPSWSAVPAVYFVQGPED